MDHSDWPVLLTASDIPHSAARPGIKRAGPPDEWGRTFGWNSLNSGEVCRCGSNCQPLVSCPCLISSGDDHNMGARATSQTFQSCFRGTGIVKPTGREEMQEVLRHIEDCFVLRICWVHSPRQLVRGFMSQAKQFSKQSHGRRFHQQDLRQPSGPSKEAPQFAPCFGPSNAAGCAGFVASEVLGQSQGGPCPVHGDFGEG